MDAHESYSRLEQLILPKYRDNINHAKSTEDVKKFFVYAVRDLLEKALGDKVELEYEQIRLDLDKQEHFDIAETLIANPDFGEVWEKSDMPNIVSRLASTAYNHYLHLDNKHPDRTESKMFQKSDRVSYHERGH